MSKFAIIATSGTQFKVAKGDEIEVDRIEGKEGKKVVFDKVLLLVDGEKVKIGQSALEGVAVEAKILEQFQGKKIRVATYKAKSRYRRVKGFRAQLTKLKIVKIVSSGK